MCFPAKHPFATLWCNSSQSTLTEHVFYSVFLSSSFLFLVLPPLYFFASCIPSSSKTFLSHYFYSSYYQYIFAVNFITFFLFSFVLAFLANSAVSSSFQRSTLLIFIQDINIPHSIAIERHSLLQNCSWTSRNV